jgi:hypothetical protein
MSAPGLAKDRAAGANAEKKTSDVPLGSERACSGRHARPLNCLRLPLRQHTANRSDADESVAY